jgi:hypothetical protein
MIADRFRDGSLSPFSNDGEACVSDRLSAPGLALRALAAVIPVAPPAAINATTTPLPN